MELKKVRKQIIQLPLVFIFAMIGNVSNGQPLDGSLPQFKKHTLSNDFISEGVAVGDVNKDGLPDILAGPCWFEAPDWKRHEIAPPEVFSIRTQYSHSFLDYSMDVNLDGWTDLIVIDFPGTSAVWYENPKNAGGYWKKHLIYETVGNESPAFVDVDGDGRTDLLCADSKERQMIWLKAPTNKKDTAWERFPISEKDPEGTDIFSHGLGYGDVNHDGRADLIIKNGWWEAPLDRKQPNWTFHRADLGEDCSQMYVMDVNQDGMPDVISASAHKYGIWWHEQGKDDQGKPSWEQHVISYSVSQTHSLAMADFNGDGHPDFVTGKRYFAHLEHYNPGNRATIDPGSYEKPVIYWFEYTPGKKPYWIEHEIDDDSGVGLNISIQDMNKDGMPDIIISNKKGVFYFENLMKKK
ncbi:MAG: FG-GAP repeat domain-containing protein [Chitinophagales bacterium]